MNDIEKLEKVTQIAEIVQSLIAQQSSGKDFTRLKQNLQVTMEQLIAKFGGSENAEMRDKIIAFDRLKHKIFVKPMLDNMAN